MNIWNIIPNLPTNSDFEMWAEKWTIMQEASLWLCGNYFDILGVYIGQPINVHYYCFS